MLDVLRDATLVAATVATGLVAGLFYAFSVSVMPGLSRAGDRTFVDAMQRINVAILNPGFFLSFLGAPVLTLTATALHLGGSARPALGLTAAALLLHGLVLVITMGVNVPLNNALVAAGPADQIIDLAGVREHYEARWVRWNIARAVASTAALGCLTLASCYPAPEQPVDELIRAVSVRPRWR